MPVPVPVSGSDERGRFELQRVAARPPGPVQRAMAATGVRVGRGKGMRYVCASAGVALASFVRSVPGNRRMTARFVTGGAAPDAVGGAW